MSGVTLVGYGCAGLDKRRLFHRPERTFELVAPQFRSRTLEGVPECGLER